MSYANENSKLTLTCINDRILKHSMIQVPSVSEVVKFFNIIDKGGLNLYQLMLITWGEMRVIFNLQPTEKFDCRDLYSLQRF